MFIADVTEGDALENPFVEVGARRRPGRRLRVARTVASIGVMAGLCAATAILLSLPRSAPQAAFPAAFPSQTGLVGYWAADSQALVAATGPDLSGIASYVDGPSGKAFNLAAGSLSSTQLATVSNAVSVMMWIKPANVGTVMTLASRSTGPGMTSALDDRHSFDLWLDPRGVLVWETDDIGARVPEELRASVPTIFNGQYHLVAATWDTNAFNIYLDGGLIASKKSQGGPLNAAATTPFRLGGPFAYTGAIDEPSVWSRVLTATEIANYYNTTPPRVTANAGVRSPLGVAFDGTSIWVTSYINLGTVSKINPTTNFVDATVAVGSAPTGVAFDGTSIWVANAQSGTVSKINPTTNDVTATVAVGAFPDGVAFDGSSIWVANYNSGTVSKVDPTTNTVTATVAVGSSAYAVAFDGTSIWVTNVIDDTVSKIDPTTDTVTATITVAGHPDGVAFDGTNIWVTNSGPGTVSKIDPTTNDVTATVTVGSNPHAVTFDGTNIWVTNLGAGTVSRINPTTATVTATVTVGGFPRGVAFGGNSIWVANFTLGTVSKIPV